MIGNHMTDETGHAPEKVAVSVNAGRVTGKLDRFWRYIGYDECNYTHTPEGEELLSKFGRLADAPYYVRTHHLFCTGNCHGTYKWGSTNAYSEDENGFPVYDWTVIDRIFDILVRNSCRPFVELGFMPMDLIDSSFFSGANDWEKYGRYRQSGWAMPPKDYGRWHDLVRELVRRCVERYGDKEVLSWYWELWNEPDIFYWRGTHEEFCRLFDYTEAAVHSVLENARLGGPGTTDPVPGSPSLEFLEKFFDHCVNGTNHATGKKGTRLDYVTFHTKGGGFPFNPRAPKATPSVKKLVHQVRTGLEAVKKYGYGDREIVLSEADPDGWAAGGIYDNPNMNFRNTEYYASFVASSYDHIRRLALATASDIRPLAWAFMFVGERCFEGTRTFVTQRIEKPVFKLWNMYEKLGDRCLEFRSSRERYPSASGDLPGTGEEPEVSGLATLDGDGTVEILVYSHHDDWDVETEFEVEIAVAGLKAEDADGFRIRHFRIDDRHSNAYAEWVRQGRPPYPAGGQYAAIKARDSLETAEIDTVSDRGTGLLLMKFSMPAHAVSLVEVEKAVTPG